MDWAKECFDWKKSPTILRISIKSSAILVTDYDQFESLVGQREKTKFLNSMMNFANGRLGLWRRCCLTKGLVVLKRKSTKRHRPSLKPSEIFWRMRSSSVFSFLVLQDLREPEIYKVLRKFWHDVRLSRTIYREKSQGTWEVMQAIEGNRAWPSWLLQVPPGRRKADKRWLVGQRKRCSVCRS